MNRNRKRRWILACAASLGVAIATACDHLPVQMVPGGPGSTSSSSGGPGASSGGVGPGGPGVDSGPPVVIVDPEAGAPDVVKIACTDTPYSDPWSPGYTQDPTVLANTQSTVSALALTDQANQMRGTSPGAGATNFTDIFRTPDDVAHGIRGFKFRDGPRGVCLEAPTQSGGVAPHGYATAFPAPMSRGAAFDMDLEYKIGVGIGDETIASGNTMLLAPVINLLRNPLWGRAQETYGEDSFLLGRLGTAFTAGAQTFLPACVKHYAAYDVEAGRSSFDAHLDEQTLREFYTRHFEMVVREGGASCVMASYNLINGVKAAANPHLLTDILRGDMGYKGFVLSDWFALPPGTAAGAAPDQLQGFAAAGVKAGLDMELPWTYAYSQIEAITGTGKPLSTDQVAQSASRIIEQKYRFNVGTMSSSTIGLQTPTTTYDGDSIGNNSANIALALRAALESIVLLKNDNNTLPIKRSVKTIAVVGAQVPFQVSNTEPSHSQGTINFATDVRLGDLGSSRVFGDPAKSVGPFDGIKAAAGNGIKVVSGSDKSVAQNADFVVVVAGLTPQDEGEEYTGAADRQNLALDGKSGTNAQNALIADVATLNKPMVVILEGGSVIDMPWLAQVPAVVMAWYPGMVGGTALGQLLFGDANFSGKLPITWPKQLSDEPAFATGTATQFDYYAGYHYFDHNNITPLYPFGAGLSYATFQYANIEVPCTTVTNSAVVQVKADITNAGTVAGDEIAFLFVSYPSTKVRRPAKELRGFIRATIQAGQTVRVTIPLRISDLKYWDTASNAWKWESGPVKVMVGSSSANLPISDTFTVQ